MNLLRQIIITLILNTIITTNLQGQTKADTEIIIHNVTDFDQFIKAFITAGNYIKNDNYGVITTELRNSTTKPNWTHQYMYRIIRNDADVTIRPFWTMGIHIDLGTAEADAQLEKWHYSDRKNIKGFIFTETMQILKSVGYTKISFK